MTQTHKPLSVQTSASFMVSPKAEIEGSWRNKEEIVDLFILTFSCGMKCTCCGLARKQHSHAL